MSSIQISWQADNRLEGQAGHGLCIYAGQEGDWSQLVAFVVEFRWLHFGEPALVRYLPRLAEGDQSQFAALQAAVETRLQARDVSSSELIPGYFWIANG